MRHLVFNTASSHLYKKSKHLVRTPIKMTLTADQYAYYVVAGDYTAQNLPDKGFIRQLTADNIDYVGYDCLQAYNNPNRLQIWRNTNIWPIPSTWYQGGYATSAPTMSGATNSCEACIWLGAVHFTIPNDLTTRLDVTSAKINITNLGSIKCFLTPASGSTNNTRWQPPPPNNTWYWRLSATAFLLQPTELLQHSVEAPFNMAASTGTPRTAFDLWKFSGSNRDGGIAKFVAPPTYTYDLPDYVKTEISMNGGIWLSLLLNTWIGDYHNYLPSCGGIDAGYWCSVSSYLGNKLEVSLDSPY